MTALKSVSIWRASNFTKEFINPVRNSERGFPFKQKVCLTKVRQTFTLCILSCLVEIIYRLVRLLAAAIVTIVYATTGVTVAVSTTAKQNENKNDDPRTVVATKEVVTHNILTSLP